LSKCVSAFDGDNQVLSAIRVDYLDCSSGIPTTELKALKIPPEEFMLIVKIAIIAISPTTKYSDCEPVLRRSLGVAGITSLAVEG